MKGGAWVRRLLPTHRSRVRASLLVLVIAGSIVVVGVMIGSSALPVAISAWALVVALNAQFGLWRPFEARPTLALTLYHEGASRSELILARTKVVRPIDRRAIVHELSELSRQTIEPRPEPDGATSRHPSRALRRCARTVRRGARRVVSRDECLASYLRVASLALSKLRRGLVRVANDGEAPAEDLAIELEFPAGLLRARERPASIPRLNLLASTVACS